MVHAMFGMGGTEILVILIVALLFLGPDKLPDAAKQISKHIRDIKKQSRVLQQTIEDDEHIGGAIRDLKSALRGDDEPVRAKAIKAKQVIDVATTAALPEPTGGALAAGLADPHLAGDIDSAMVPVENRIHGPAGDAEPVVAEAEAPKLTLPPTAGERDFDEPSSSRADDAAELAKLVKPASNTIARGASPAPAAAPAPATASTEAPAATEAPAGDKSESSHG
jgi:sec-independent protein translocase protein TatB